MKWLSFVLAVSVVASAGGAWGATVSKITVSRAKTSGTPMKLYSTACGLNTSTWRNNTWLSGGPFLWTITKSEPDGASGDEDFTTFNGKVVSFCVDLIETVDTTPPIYYYVDDDIASVPRLDKGYQPSDYAGYYPMGTDKAAAISELWAENFSAVLSAYANSEYTTTGRMAADAFQLAIWEILYENQTVNTTDWMANGWSVATGDFYLLSLDRARSANKNALIGLADTYLKGVDGVKSDTYINTSLYAWASPLSSCGCKGYQDQLVQCVPPPTPPTPTNDVPEPSVAVGLLGLALAGACVSVRRRKQAA